MTNDQKTRLKHAQELLRRLQWDIEQDATESKDPLMKETGLQNSFRIKDAITNLRSISS